MQQYLSIYITTVQPYRPFSQHTFDSFYQKHRAYTIGVTKYKLNAAIIHVINCTCGFPAMTCKNIWCKKYPILTIRFEKGAKYARLFCRVPRWPATINSCLPILSLTFKSGLLKCKCTQYKPTHQKVQYDHIYEVHQSCALIVWWRLFHCWTVVWLWLPPKTDRQAVGQILGQYSNVLLLDTYPTIQRKMYCTTFIWYLN